MCKYLFQFDDEELNFKKSKFVSSLNFKCQIVCGMGNSYQIIHIVILQLVHAVENCGIFRLRIYFISHFYNDVAI